VSPEASRKLRFPDYMTTAQDGDKVVSLTHRPPLPPGNAPEIYPFTSSVLTKLFSLAELFHLLTQLIRPEMTLSQEQLFHSANQSTLLTLKI
jgi:hypothetical protein